MKTRAFFASFALLSGFIATNALAQWQWIDEHGRNTYSDRPPPAHIPEKNVIKAPALTRDARVNNLPKADPPAVAENPSDAQAAEPPAPSPEALKQQKEEAIRQAAEEKQQKEEQAKFLQQRQDNCNRAQTTLLTLQSDVPLAQIGPDGQQSTMSKMQREQDTRRVRDIIARDCGPLPKEKK